MTRWEQEREEEKIALNQQWQPPDNKQRAAWGLKALKTDPDWGQNEREDSLGDTLANLMHYAKMQSLDFEQALTTAYDHFHHEVWEETGTVIDDIF